MDQGSHRPEIPDSLVVAKAGQLVVDGVSQTLNKSTHQLSSTEASSTQRLLQE